MNKPLLPIIFFLLLLSCGNDQSKNRIKTTTDSPNANYNTPVPAIETLRKPNISKTKFNPEVLYGIWTVNNGGPHADFKLTKESFYIVDSEDYGKHAYSISNDTLTVEYKDYNAIGVIKKAVKDTLIINWDNSADITYFTWKG